LTPVRLFGEGLALCLDGKDDIIIDALADDFGALRAALVACRKRVSPRRR
jgi:hypothetical protein